MPPPHGLLSVQVLTQLVSGRRQRAESLQSTLEPRVTVGIPVYNGERWLAETIESVTRQSLRDIVVIVSDNASVDDSWQIAREMAERDERIQCYRNPTNIGVFRNLDRVFELSSTPYFKWCSVGDLLEPSFLERAVEVLEQQRDVVLVYAKTKFVGSLAGKSNIGDLEVNLDSHDTVTRYTTYLSARGLNSPFHGLIQSDALSRTGLNHEFRGSDHCLIAALLLCGRFVRLSDPLLLRRIEPDTATSTKSEQELNDFFGAKAVEINKLPTWKIEKRLVFDLIRARAALSVKFGVGLYLLRRLYWQRHELLKEGLRYIGKIRGQSRAKRLS